jgi:hypothetical protein
MLVGGRGSGGGLCRHGSEIVFLGVQFKSSLMGVDCQLDFMWPA